MTYATLLLVAPHLAALCPSGDDHAAAEVWACANVKAPAPPRWTQAQRAAMEPAE